MLKNGAGMVIDKPVEEKQVVVQAAVPVVETAVLLELALPKRYMRGGVLYEKGNIYKFDRAQAVILLGEIDDCGKPMWKVYREPQQVKMVAAPATRQIFDARKQKVNVITNDEPIKTPVTRIEVGNDDEIASILGNEVTI